jgi:adenine-specific DNA-methyltransferase
VQEQLEQYFTPLAVAGIMVRLFEIPNRDCHRILDPGAGSGILGALLAQRILDEQPESRVILKSVELDRCLEPYYRETISNLRDQHRLSAELIEEDFLEWSAGSHEMFDLIIQNPPYKKMDSKSNIAASLVKRGIRTPNLYSAFIQSAAQLLSVGGQMVVISPRSWTNGTYFRGFREWITRTCSLDAVHLFESRRKVFLESDVLQESLVWKISLRDQVEKVEIHVSLDQESDATHFSAPVEVVTGQDFVFLPSSQVELEHLVSMSKLKSNLKMLGLTASTGKVVDFRNRELLAKAASDKSLPFLRADHISEGATIHPSNSLKKEQWVSDSRSFPRSMLNEPGTYVLVKRFSAKEEKRRISASIWSAPVPFALDNKVNFLHQNGGGLEPDFALGLVNFLNSSHVDKYFRIFSGHTQVNAGDLMSLPLPEREFLESLAKLKPTDVDSFLERHLNWGQN